MTVADDLVAEQQPFVEASPDGSYEAFLRAIGAMFAEMESYASDADEDDSQAFFVNVPNQAPNPSFEYDQLGAAPAAWTFAGMATNLVSTVWAGDPGLRSLHLVTNALTASQRASALPTGPGVGPGLSGVWAFAAGRQVGCRADYICNGLGGGAFSGSFAAWFYDATGALISGTPIGSTPLATGVGTLNGVATAPANTAFLQLGVSFLCTTGGTLDINIDNVGTFFDVAGAVPAYNDGDQAGWEWTGNAGSSPSQMIPPLPQTGWSKMLDVNRADTKGLPYLAQWIGERVPVGMADTPARQLIRTNPNAYRGSLSSIVRGIIPMLTGSQSVYTREGHKIDGTADLSWLAVQTLASETPNATLVRQQIRYKLLGANIMLDYATLTQNTWATIETGSPSWSTVEAGPKTWQQIQNTPGVPAGFTAWKPNNLP